MGNAEKNTEMGDNKIQNAVVAALVIGLLAGFFIGRSWGKKYEDGGIDEKIKTESIENASSTKDSVSLKEGVEIGKIVIEEQTAGMSVAIAKVTLSNAGWIVVREDNGNGSGNILGAQWLSVGTADNVSVDLLRKTEAGKNYIVALHTDNGDKKFDMAADLPIMTDGKVISATFLVK